MTIIIDERTAIAKSRIAHISLALMTLRLVDTWRRAVADVLGHVPDHDTSLIIGAILCIGSEKLMRCELPSDLQTLERPMPPELLTKCNISSIAEAVGLNRETTRRKVRELIKAGVVTNDDHGLLLAGGLLQVQLVQETVLTQLNTLRRGVNELAREGVVRSEVSAMDRLTI